MAEISQNAGYEDLSQPDESDDDVRIESIPSEGESRGSTPSTELKTPISTKRPTGRSVHQLRKRTKRERDEEEIELLKQLVSAPSCSQEKNVLQSQDTEVDSFCAYIRSKLNELSKRNRLLAQNRIQNMLFDIEMSEMPTQPLSAMATQPVRPQGHNYAMQYDHGFGFSNREMNQNTNSATNQFIPPILTQQYNERDPLFTKHFL